MSNIFARDGSAPTPELLRALGAIALADSEADEWQMQAIYSLMAPQPQNVVKILVGNDSAATRASKLKRLLCEAGWAELKVGQLTISQSVAKLQSLKDRRDHALHSVYMAEVKPDNWETYRVRSGHTTTSIADLDALEADYRAHISFLTGLTIRIEEAAAAQAAMQARREYLLTQARFAPLSTEGKKHLANVDASGPGSFTMDELGRVVSGVSESDEQDYFLVTVDPSVGRVDVRSTNGEHFVGGDTGWRDVTAEAERHDPAITEAFWRRVDDEVFYTQRGGSGIDAQPDSLTWRISNSAINWLPEWLNKLGDFVPPSPDE